jgi:hypothetical protein
MDERKYVIDVPKGAHEMQIHFFKKGEMYPLASEPLYINVKDGEKVKPLKLKTP